MNDPSYKFSISEDYRKGLDNVMSASGQGLMTMTEVNSGISIENILMLERINRYSVENYPKPITTEISMVIGDLFAAVSFLGNEVKELRSKLNENVKTNESVEEERFKILEDNLRCLKQKFDKNK